MCNQRTSQNTNANPNELAFQFAIHEQVIRENERRFRRRIKIFAYLVLGMTLLAVFPHPVSYFIDVSTFLSLRNQRKTLEFCNDVSLGCGFTLMLLLLTTFFSDKLQIIYPRIMHHVFNLAILTIVIIMFTYMIRNELAHLTKWEEPHYLTAPKAATWYDLVWGN